MTSVQSEMKSKECTFAPAPIGHCAANLADEAYKDLLEIRTPEGMQIEATVNVIIQIHYVPKVDK